MFGENFEDFFEDSSIGGYDPEASDVPSGLFAEAAESCNQLMENFQTALERSDMLLESVQREYDLNVSRAELKCMKESGTVDDLVYLEEAASEGALAKFKKMISRLIEMWRDFCAKIRNQVMSKICSKKARTTLNKVEKKIKLNPLLARKKIEVMNNKKALGVIKKYKSNLDKIAAKAIKGLGPNEQTAKTLADTKDDFRREFNRAIAGKMGITVATVAATIAQLNTEIDKLPDFVNNCEKVNSVTLERLKDTVSEEAAAAATAATQAAMTFRNELAKEELNQHISYIMDLMSALRKVTMKGKGKTQAKAMKESAEDDDDLLNDSFDPFFEEFGEDDGGEDDSDFIESCFEEDDIFSDEEFLNKLLG